MLVFFFDVVLLWIDRIVFVIEISVNKIELEIEYLNWFIGCDVSIVILYFVGLKWWNFCMLVWLF